MEDQPFILVVEDVAHVRDLLELTLRFQGYEVHSVSDGAAALEAVRQRQPALVVTDILMPRLDDYSLAYHLRKNPETREIPSIFISATYVTPEDKAFALALGAAHFVEKPIDTEEFLLIVAEVLAARQRGEKPALDEKAFYEGHRERLETKLRQKSQQAARIQRLIPTLPEQQRKAYEAMLAEVERQREAIREELAQVYEALRNLERNAAP